MPHLKLWLLINCSAIGIAWGTCGNLGTTLIFNIIGNWWDQVGTQKSETPLALSPRQEIMGPS